MDRTESLAALQLVSAALMGTLIPKLVERGVLTDEDAHEIYETALLMIETGQGSDPAAQSIYETARQIIEKHLGAPRSR
jgi:hypothetical protein